MPPIHPFVADDATSRPIVRRIDQRGRKGLMIAFGMGVRDRFAKHFMQARLAQRDDPGKARLTHESLSKLITPLNENAAISGRVVRCHEAA